MGAPTKTQIELWSDHIAYLMQKDLDGFLSEYSAMGGITLWDKIDASGDPPVENALGSVSLAIDEQSLPANHRTCLTAITGRTAYKPWVTALNSLVKSVAGGSYSTLRAYLVAISAKVHPLFGELVRHRLGEPIFSLGSGSSAVVLGVSNPTYAAIFPNKVYTGADGSLADDTTDAIDVGTADVPLFANDNEAIYIGCDRPFNAIVFALSTLSSANTVPTFKYWNGSSWATLTCTDNTVGFTKSEVISFTAPADWVRSYKDLGGTALADNARLYYIRIDRTENTVVTPPVATCITLIPTAITATVSGSTHLGIPQPPLALCRITAASTMTVTLPANIDWTRWAEPVGTENKLRLRALTVIASDLTVTLDYVKQTAANAQTAQSAWTAPAALGVKTLALTSTDALRSVRTTTAVSTAAVTGVFAVEADVIRAPALA